jgi:hypothetical protein
MSELSRASPLLLEIVPLIVLDFLKADGREEG